MVESNNAINNTVGASISGVTNTLTVTNPSNTASSAARATISVGGGSSADPTLNFNVSGVTDWEMGADNNASDSFKISQSTALGTNDTFIMTTAGERTMPLQPAFFGYLPSTDANATGDNTSYTIGGTTALTEVFDQGNDFTTSGVFTAPVTGRYYFSMGLDVNPLTSAHVFGNHSIVTSNRSYLPTVFNPFATWNSAGGCTFNSSLFADMDAGDTATARGVVNGGAKTVGVVGSASTRTYFSGALIC